MYAIIETGGKQYRVQVGDTLDVERVDAAVGETVELDRILLLRDGDQIQADSARLAGARVRATVVEQDLGPKVVVFRFKPKKRYQRRAGHRQPFSRLRIEEILTETPKPRRAAKKTTGESEKAAGKASGGKASRARKASEKGAEKSAAAQQREE